MSQFPTLATDDELSTNAEVGKLIRSLQLIARNTRLAQSSLSVLLGGRSVFEPTYIEGVPATPEEVWQAWRAHPQAQSYWVVLRGREPGLYTTVAAANLQTDGIPHQFQQCHTGLDAALDFYGSNYPDNVKKFVLVEPAGSAGSNAPAGSEWVSVPESAPGSSSSEYRVISSTCVAVFVASIACVGAKSAPLVQIPSQN
ncbi:hypothetical protein B0H13DRAFT_2502112 [Mycena leptocephala]|nr:hypothetical protein B0H13DRAFT_2502112 [Mycena leptocephala]